MSPTLVRPPAKATKKKSGKRAGAKNAGLAKYLYVCLPATAHATARKPPPLTHHRAHRGRPPAHGRGVAEVLVGRPARDAPGDREEAAHPTPPSGGWGPPPRRWRAPRSPP